MKAEKRQRTIAKSVHLGFSTSMTQESDFVD
jgi:hypothetical protein